MANLLPVAYVLANPSELSITLVKELLAKSCRVVVITNHKNEFAGYFSHHENLTVKDFRERVSEIPTYLFFVQGFSHKDPFFSRDQIRIVLKYCEMFSPKTQVILPYVVDSATRGPVEFIMKLARKVMNRNLGIIFAGNLYGAGMDISDHRWINKIFKQIYHRQPVSVPEFDIDIYIVHVHQLVEALLKGIFSYGFEKREIVVTSKLKAFAFCRKMQELIPDLIFVSDPGVKQEATVSNFDFKELPIGTDKLEETLRWLFASDHGTYFKEKKAPRKFKLKFGKRRTKILLLSFVALFWILILPFASLLFSGLTLKTGFNSLSQMDFKSADFYFNLSESFASFSKFGFKFFDYGEKAAVFIDSFDEFGKKASQTFILFGQLGSETYGNKDYDLSGQSNQLFLDVDDLYKQTSFLQADINTDPGLASFLPDNFDIGKIRFYAENARKIIQGIPSLLGDSAPKNYMVLLQDGNELMPTGGKISSFGIFQFKNGLLTSKDFTDTTSADSQLRGHVDPPNALQKYLGQKNWSLGYSNWDPDFTGSAAKAEWFLQNETGQLVDGVVAVDLNVFNKLKDFSGNFLQWGSEIFKDLNTKELQVFLNDGNFSDSISNLGWDGNVTPPPCSGNCAVDYLGVVEANLGLNKVNANITRSASLTANFAGVNIQNTLSITYKNTSDANPYRTYIRILAPVDASFDKAVETIDGTDQTMPLDIENINGRTEAGVLVQVPQKGSTTNIIFTWTAKNTVDYSKSGKIILYLRKQPGVFSMPTSINLSIPASLTNGTGTSYNTSLLSDFTKEISW